MRISDWSSDVCSSDLLGRLFAVYELAQRSALGRVNATIRDKYFGAASATPASVFPLIVRGAQPHLAKVRKERPGWGHLIERELEEITGRFDPDVGGTLPRSLRLRSEEHTSELQSLMRISY